MMYALLVSTALAFAGDGGDASTTAVPCSAGNAAQHAEYQRLNMEMDKLATRNAWTGVERTFQSLVETRVCLTYDNWMIGAHAARAIGDVTSARQRLYKANEIKDGERDVLDWLWDIDSNYGVVFLGCNPHTLALSIDAMPFDPVQAQAVQFAVAKIDETGVFEGYLPQGTYKFGETTVVVQPRVQATRIDLRTDDVPKKDKPPKKKKKDKDEPEVP
jgi:hypothetical protein